MSSKCRCFLNTNAPNLSLQNRFLLYIYAKIAILFFAEKTYSSFYDAIYANSNRPIMAYLPEFQFDASFFNGFTALVKDIEPCEFLDKVVPGLVVCDAETLLSKIAPNHIALSPRNQIYLLLRIMGCLFFKEYSDIYHYPPQVYRIQFDHLRDVFYSGYYGWGLHAQYDKIIFPTPFREDLFDLWKVMYGFPYDTSPATKTTGVSGIVNDLHASGLNDDNILDLFSTAKLHKKLEASDPNNPISYLKKVVLDQRIALSDNSVISPAERFLLSDELLKQCVARWRNTDSVDFIRSLLYSKASASITTENAIMLHRINEAVSYGVSKLFLVDANPNLIATIAQNQDSSSTAAFGFFNLSLTQLYKERFPDLHFVHIMIDEHKQFVFHEHVLDQSHKGRESHFDIVPLSPDYCDVTFFVNQKNADSIYPLFSQLSRSLPFCDFSFFAPHIFIEKLESAQKSEICSRFNNINIHTLPTDDKYLWLKKNLILTLSARAAKDESIQIKKYNLDGDILLLDPWFVAVPHSEFISPNEYTINSLWERNRLKPPSGEKRITRYYNYSKEIIIWYSYSFKTGRGKHHFCATPTDEQRKRNAFARGKRLNAFHEFVAPDLSHVEHMLNEAVFGDPLDKTIQKEIKHSYKNKPMSLKTFWFCYLPDLEKIPGFKRELSKKLFVNTELSDFMSDAEYTLSDYTEVINGVLSVENDVSQFALWQQLNIILTYANSFKRFSPNPVREFVQKQTERNKDYQDARRNLAKRSYELFEEQLMLDYFEANWKDKPVLIGCIISFYTGMSNREILALNWEDIHRIFDNYFQFWITKKYSSADEIVSFSDNELYANRRFPISADLFAYLDAHRKFITEKLKAAGQFNEAQFKKFPIVCSNDGSFAKRCTLYALLNAKKAMEEAAGIEPLDIGDDDESTDINKYGGDRFHSNFHYRINQTCKMSMAEINYLLGKTPPTTFSKHYCDYANDFAQITLSNKLNRWQHGPSLNVTKPFRYKIRTDGRALKLPLSNERSCIQVDFSVEQSTDDSIEVSINSNHGIDVIARCERSER